VLASLQPPPPPQVRAKLLSVTQTLSGINLKQILVGTVTDQVRAPACWAGGERATAGRPRPGRAPPPPRPASCPSHCKP
jgi:hypothetical protein